MSDCKKCKKKSLTDYNKLIMPISVFIVLTSLIGVVTIVKYIISLF